MELTLIGSVVAITLWLIDIALAAYFGLSGVPAIMPYTGYCWGLFGLGAAAIVGGALVDWYQT